MCRKVNFFPTAANVKIKLSANAAPLISITRSFELDRRAQWVPKVHPITPMLVTKPDHKPDVVAGCSVQRAPDARVLPRYGDLKTLLWCPRYSGS